MGAGLLLTIDYGGSAEDLLGRALAGGTLRSFGSHSVMYSVLDRPGSTDLTADVNFSDLIRWGSLWGWDKICLEPQHDFMMAQGMLEEISRMAARAAEGKGLQEYLAAKRFLIPGDIQERYHVLIQSRGKSTNSPARTPTTTTTDRMAGQLITRCGARRLVASVE